MGIIKTHSEKELNAARGIVLGWNGINEKAVESLFGMRELALPHEVMRQIVNEILKQSGTESPDAKQLQILNASEEKLLKLMNAWLPDTEAIFTAVNDLLKNFSTMLETLSTTFVQQHRERFNEILKWNKLNYLQVARLLPAGSKHVGILKKYALYNNLLEVKLALAGSLDEKNAENDFGSVSDKIFKLMVKPAEETDHAAARRNFQEMKIVLERTSREFQGKVIGFMMSVTQWVAAFETEDLLKQQEQERRATEVLPEQKPTSPMEEIKEVIVEDRVEDANEEIEEGFKDKRDHLTHINNDIRKAEQLLSNNSIVSTANAYKLLHSYVSIDEASHFGTEVTPTKELTKQLLETVRTKYLKERVLFAVEYGEYLITHLSSLEESLERGGKSAESFDPITEQATLAEIDKNKKKIEKIEEQIASPGEFRFKTVQFFKPNHYESLAERMDELTEKNNALMKKLRDPLNKKRDVQQERNAQIAHGQILVDRLEPQVSVMRSRAKVVGDELERIQKIEAKLPGEEIRQSVIKEATDIISQSTSQGSNTSENMDKVERAYEKLLFLVSDADRAILREYFATSANPEEGVARTKQLLAYVKEATSDDPLAKNLPDLFKYKQLQLQKEQHSLETLIHSAEDKIKIFTDLQPPPPQSSSGMGI